MSHSKTLQQQLVCVSRPQTGPSFHHRVVSFKAGIRQHNISLNRPLSEANRTGVSWVKVRVRHNLLSYSIQYVMWKTTDFTSMTLHAAKMKGLVSPNFLCLDTLLTGCYWLVVDLPDPRRLSLATPDWSPLRVKKTMKHLKLSLSRRSTCSLICLSVRL